MDCREAPRDGRQGVEFSWQGSDECDPAGGRGWAMLEDDGSLRGRIFFHLGDDSALLRIRRAAARDEHGRRTEAAVTGNARRPADPLEREIEAALDPGRSVGDPACLSFVSGLEEVENEIAELTGTAPAPGGRPVRGVPGRLFREGGGTRRLQRHLRHVRRRHVLRLGQGAAGAGPAPEETAARLLAWMDDDPYGFCSRLEQDVAGVLDKAGRPRNQQSTTGTTPACPLTKEWRPP